MPGLSLIAGEVDVEKLIRSAVVDLVSRYGRDLTASEIETIVRQCFSDWDDAKIKDFVPVLAERCAKEVVGREAQRVDANEKLRGNAR